MQQTARKMHTSFLNTLLIVKARFDYCKSLCLIKARKIGSVGTVKLPWFGRGAAVACWRVTAQTVIASRATPRRLYLWVSC